MTRPRAWAPAPAAAGLHPAGVGGRTAPRRYWSCPSPCLQTSCSARAPCRNPASGAGTRAGRKCGSCGGSKESSQEHVRLGWFTTSGVCAVKTRCVLIRVRFATAGSALPLDNNPWLCLGPLHAGQVADPEDLGSLAERAITRSPLGDVDPLLGQQLSPVLFRALDAQVHVVRDLPHGHTVRLLAHVRHQLVFLCRRACAQDSQCLLCAHGLGRMASISAVLLTS